MTENEINIAIAESVGWVMGPPLRNPSGNIVNSCYCEPWRLPDYCNDLNAMHEAERKLAGAECFRYVEELNKATKCFIRFTPAIMVFATARQRAEAFLRTKRPELFS